MDRWLNAPVKVNPAQLTPQRGKLLIVSSYRRPCGIAQYLEHLEPALREQATFDVEIVALPVDLLRSQSPYARKGAKKAMREILQRVSAADVVNIQLEPGLFGLTPMAIWERLNAILKASRKVILTYHTVPPTRAVRPSLSPRGVYRFIQTWRGNYVFDHLFAKIRSNPGKFSHIVQTKRDAERFEMLGIRRDTIDFRPLSFLDEQFRHELAVKRNELQRAIREEYSISGKIVGCFGFLSPYKGIEVAIRALQHLPDDHHLLIVGGLHPEGIELATVEQKYLKALFSELKLNSQPQLEPNSSSEPKSNSSLLKRVHFCGALDNKNFTLVMAACDAVILPYAEVGQTSSGPAALALDMQLPVYCSRNDCFRELDKYQPGILSFFEIGNYLELAEKIRRRDGDKSDRIMARQHYLENFNVHTRAQAYIHAFERLHQALI